MISAEKIRALAEEKLVDTQNYLVDVILRPGNKITVLLDSMNGGISINDCVQISRQIESNLDREVEDFELNVSSSGLDRPFKVLKQYIKNIGKEVEIVTKENKKLTGILLDANETEVILEAKTKEKVDGKKGKQTIIKTHKLNYNQIKETKIVISF